MLNRAYLCIRNVDPLVFPFNCTVRLHPKTVKLGTGVAGSRRLVNERVKSMDSAVTKMRSTSLVQVVGIPIKIVDGDPTEMLLDRSR